MSKFEEDSNDFLDSVTKTYRDKKEIWPKTDRWHLATKAKIDTAIDRHIAPAVNNITKIINLGSGGNSYGLEGSFHLHVDIVEDKLLQTNNYIVGSIEDLLIDDDQFDIGICVGSVINYCDAIRALTTASRLLRSGALFALEFEQTENIEFAFTPAFCKRVAFVETFYDHQPEKIWVYSVEFIRRLLTQTGFQILHQECFHILSSVIYRLTSNEDFSSTFAEADSLLNRLPFVRKFGSNSILICQKI
jgi:SAM-dependent methyltransferase